MYTTLTQRGYQWIINGYVRHARIVNSVLSAACRDYPYAYKFHVPVNRQMISICVHFFIYYAIYI